MRHATLFLAVLTKEGELNPFGFFPDRASAMKALEASDDAKAEGVSCGLIPLPYEHVTLPAPPAPAPSPEPEPAPTPVPDPAPAPARGEGGTSSDDDPPTPGEG